MSKRGLVIIGNYGATNVGDEAVLAGLLILAKSHHPDLDVTVLSYDPARTEHGHACRSAPLLPFGVRSFLRFDWGRTFGILSQAREVWIGGGALFTDEKFFAVFLWGWHVLWSRLLAQKVSLVANTVGPIRTSLGNILMRIILRMVDVAALRDAESEKVLRRLGFEGKITIGADPAFLIEPISGAVREKKIIVSLRPWIRKTPNLLQDLAAWIDKRAEEGYRIVLLPFQTMHDDDRTVLSQVHSLVTEREMVTLIEEAEDLSKVMQHIASAELVVGMRLHSLILSALQGTPFLGLSYSDKVSNFCRSAGMEEYCLHVDIWRKETFVTQAAKVLANANGIRTMLTEKNEGMRQAALSLSPKP